MRLNHLCNCDTDGIDDGHTTKVLGWLGSDGEVEMNSSGHLWWLFIVAVAYVVGLGRGTSRAEKEANQYLSSLESAFLESGELPPLCKIKWNEAKSSLEDFRYDEPESNENPWSDPP